MRKRWLRITLIVALILLPVTIQLTYWKLTAYPAEIVIAARAWNVGLQRDLILIDHQRPFGRPR